MPLSQSGGQNVGSSQIIDDQIIDADINSAAAIKPSKLDPSTFTKKAGVTTRDLSTASGTQVIAHGLGKVPSRVIIKGLFFYYNNYNYINISDGVYTPSGNSCIYGAVKEQDSANVQGNSNTYAIVLMPSIQSTVKQEGVITVDATNITITWTKTGSPTGTAQILWQAE